MELKIAPSILTADFSNLKAEIWAVEKAGCSLVHLDVMDGHFVPNITFGPALIASLRKGFEIPFDMHLMIEEPERYLNVFADADGCVPGSIFTFHKEVVEDPLPLIRKIHEKGLLAGMAINPKTPASECYPYLEHLDMVLVMTVEPGYGGQGLIESCLPKIMDIRKKAEEIGKDLLIEVDGGIKPNNVALVKGANLVVMGSAVFKHGDLSGAYERFMEAQKALEAVYKEN